MSSIAFVHADRSTEMTEPMASPAELTTDQMVILRRTGKQPLRFRGRQVLEATGHSTEGRIWHEINIWHKIKGDCFVVDLRVFKKAPGEKDIFHAESFSSMAEAVAYLESFDPKQDINVNIDTDSQVLTTAELTLKAVALRQQLEEAERLYQTLLGDLLYQIETSNSLHD